MNEILNPDSICEDCGTKWTSDGEWVMDVFKCYDYPEYCQNCCGCEDCGNAYEPKKETN